MGKWFFLTALCALGLLSCSTLATSTPTATTEADLSQGYIRAENPYAAQFSDTTKTRGSVFVRQTQTMQPELDKPVFFLNIQGDLASPCHELRAVVNPPDPDGNLHINAYTVVELNTECDNVMSSFQASVPLGTFSPGHYILWLNGKIIDEFNAW